MKILSIKLKNLASLEGSFEIDFQSEPLLSAGIFAITGPTGAGKSTILDAICLALYAQTPRHSNAKEQGIKIQDTQDEAITHYDVRGILRKGSSEGFAEVSFVGTDGDCYLSRWSVRRSYGKIDGSLQNASIELRNLSKNKLVSDKTKETLKEIERLVGLNFNQFTRSVLLAQGDFTAFLRADRDEKSSLLEKLTGIDIYSTISQQVYRKYKESEAEIDLLNLQLQGVASLSNDEISAINQQIEAFSFEIKSLNEALAGVNRGLEWYKTNAELTKAKGQALQEIESTRQQLVDAAGRFKQLHLIEKVFELKPLFENINKISNSLEDKTKENQTLEAKIELFKKELFQFEEKRKQADEAQTKAETEYQLMLPELDKAREKDILIKEKREQFNALNEELERTQLEKERIETDFSKKKEDLGKNEAEAKSLGDWLKKFQEHGPMAKNVDLILSKLDDLKKIIANNQIVDKSLIEAGEKIHEHASAIKKLESDIKVLHVELSENIEKITELHQEIEQIPEQQLKNTLDNHVQLLQSLNESKNLWEQIHINQHELQNLDVQCAENAKNLNVAKTREIQLVTELEQARLLKVQSQKLFEKAKFEASKDVEQLRASLTDGEACPVCGSPNHPYMHENRPLNNIFNELQQEAKHCEIAFENLLKESITLEETGKNLEKFQTELEGRKISLHQKLSAFQQKWEQSPWIKDIIDIAEADRSQWFESLTENSKHAYQQANLQLEKLNLLKKESEGYKKALENRKDNLSGLIKIEGERKIMLANEIREQLRLAGEQEMLNVQITNIRETLNPLLNNTTWYEKWLDDPASFSVKTKDFAQKWNESTRRLEEVNRQHDVLAEALQGIQNQMCSAEEVFTLTNAKYQLAGKQLNTFIMERSQIIQGREVVDEENRLKKQIDNTRTTLELLNKEKNQAESEILRQLSYKEKTVETLKELEESRKETEKTIANWLEEYNKSNTDTLNTVQVQELLAYSTEWISVEKASLDILEKDYARAKAIFEERNRLVGLHAEKNENFASFEELSAKQEEINTNLNTINHKKNEFIFKLKQDEQNKLQAGDLLKELEKKKLPFENLQKLNEIIGSADGKKFRMLAQEYTLEVLLSFANVHLCELTSRYKLDRVPNSLALQVVDQDMGDEIRSVHSLSGGESFLVSLALALGLASLSSNKMKVESLFIDEGFGSLDPATLNIAMDALEQLKNQGRKVGVISHVQEMTERIHTQIKVSRMANGKSRIEVIGY